MKSPMMVAVNLNFTMIASGSHSILKLDLSILNTGSLEFQVKGNNISIYKTLDLIKYTLLSDSCHRARILWMYWFFKFLWSSSLPAWYGYSVDPIVPACRAPWRGSYILVTTWPVWPGSVLAITHRWRSDLERTAWGYHYLPYIRIELKKSSSQLGLIYISRLLAMELFNFFLFCFCLSRS
jgi:hypothetical protein